MPLDLPTVGDLGPSWATKVNSALQELDSRPSSESVLTLKELAALLDPLIVGAITRDANGAATSAGVVWPDGSPGTYTATVVSSAFPGAVDAYTVTKGSPVVLSFTQPQVTRDSNGAITNRPAITVS